jgi:hypothetical protein
MEHASISLFQYRPISGDEIRILEVQPGSPQAPLYCILHTVNRQDTVNEYEALSYAWGTGAARREVYVRYEDTATYSAVSVGSSLATALLYLRLQTEKRQVWADYLCINQGDSKEKGQQVAMMGQIFNSAKLVVAFLGPAGSEGKLAFETIQGLAEGTKDVQTMMIIDSY